MSSIDERIVAMRFNNSQFEKGVKESMRTLAELREATNLDDVAVNMKDVSKSINQNLQFESPTKSAGIFSKALTSLGKVAKTTFNAATFPLQALGRSLQSLGKYTRAVLGIDIASQLVHTGEQVIRAFTIDPLKSGWNEYELKMDSIKTIMTGTVKTYTDAMTKKDPQFLYDEEKHLDYVKQGLEELNTYADQTVYSFQDMTSNIGKFTNAGVDFETAVDAIKGVANAAAHAGQGAAQASMAMYNISQSLGMGYLGMMDWRSIENANMATLTFKQTLIDMGVALGQLKRDEQSGKLYTINEKGVVDNSLEVTAENLRETLSKKWVNKEVLLNALRVYSGEFSEEELRSLKNLSDEEKAALRKIGEEAALAATQVRTFTKMWDALKEAAQSGWAISWELIFGDLNEATNFWTDLNKRFSGFLDQQAESRNALLHAWRGQRQQYNYETGEIEWISDERLVDGRKILIDSLNGMLSAISSVGNAIGKAWSDVFGVFSADTLMNITKRFGAFTKNLTAWLGSSDDSESRLSKLSRGFRGLFSVIKAFADIGKKAGSAIAKALKPIANLAIDKFAEFGDFLAGLTNGDAVEKITELKDSFAALFKEKAPAWFKKTGDSMKNFFTTAKNSVVKWLSQNGMSGTASFIESIWGSVTGVFQKITSWSGWETARKHIDGIMSVFRPVTVEGKNGNTWTQDSPFVSWVKNAWTDMEAVFAKIVAWSGWTTIGNYIDGIVSVFRPVTVMGKQGNTWTQDSPFVSWVKNLWAEAKETFEEVKSWSGWETIGARIESMLSVFRPVTVAGKQGNTWTQDSPFVSWIKNAWEGIQGVISGMNLDESFGSGLAKLQEFAETIMQFIIPSASAEETSASGGIISSAVSTISSEWSANKGTVETVSTELTAEIGNITGVTESFNKEVPKGGILQWFMDLGNGLNSAWNSVSASIAKIAEDVGKVTDSVTNALTTFIEWASSVDWNDALSQLEGHSWNIAGIFALFSGGKFLRNIGSLGKSGGKMAEAFGSLAEVFGKNTTDLAKTAGETMTELGKNLGEGVQSFAHNFDASKRLDAIGNVVLKFAGAVLIMVGALYALTQIVETVPPESLKTATILLAGISVFMGAVMGVSYLGGASSAKLGTSVLAFSVGLLLIIRAIKSIAKMSSEGINFTSAIDVLFQLTLLIGAFEGLSTAEFGAGGGWIISLGKNKNTGLIGFVVAIEGLIMAVKQLAELQEKGVDIGKATGVLWELQAMILAFEALSTMEFGVGGEDGGLLSLGKNKKTGLIGFALAIEAMVLAIYQLSSLPTDQVDKGIGALEAMTRMIAKFEIFKGLGNLLGTWNGEKNRSGLLGFVAAITAMLVEVAAIGGLDPAKSENGIKIMDSLTDMIAKFELSKGAGNFLSSFASMGTQVMGLVQLTAFVGAIAGLLYAVSDLASKDLDVDKTKSLVDILGQIALIIGGSGTAIAAVTAVMGAVGPAVAGKGVAALGIIFGGTGLLGVLVAAISWLADSWIGTENLELLPEKIERFGNIFVALASVLGEVIGAITHEVTKGLTSGYVEGESVGMADGLKALTAAANQLTDDDVTQLGRVMKALNIISDNLPHNPGLLERWFGHQMTLGQFGENMRQLGTGFANLYYNIKDVQDFAMITQGIDAISSLVRAAGTIALIDKISDGTYNSWDYVGRMFELIGSLSTKISQYGNEGFAEEFSPLATFGELFGEQVSQVADEISIEPIIQSVLNQMASGKVRIAEGFGDMFPSSVAPVYDVEDESDLPLFSYQNGSLKLAGTVQIDTASLSGVVSAINTQGDHIVAAVNNMGTRIDNLGAAISRIQIVLDTGALAGAMDIKLGQSATLQSRTGASSGTTRVYNSAQARLQSID